MKLHGMRESGNCWKAPTILALTNHGVELIHTDANAGATQDPVFLAIALNLINRQRKKGRVRRVARRVRPQRSLTARRNGTQIVRQRLAGKHPLHRRRPSGFLNILPIVPLTLAPQRTWFTYGTFKAFTPCLRCAWLIPLPTQTGRAEDLVHASVWPVPPFGAAIALRWVADGTSQSIILVGREKATLLQIAANRFLPTKFVRQTAPASMYLWLYLPERTRAEDIAERAFKAGVRVASAGAFALGSGSASFRILLSAASDVIELETALARLITVVN